METTQEGTVIGVVNDFLRDWESRDVDTVMSHYAPPIAGFGTGADKKFSGLDQVRAGIERDFAQSGSWHFDLTSKGLTQLTDQTVGLSPLSKRNFYSTA